MKLIFRILAGLSLGFAAFLWVSMATGATSKEALVTQIIREVQLLPANDSARDAVVNEKVSEDTGVRTGTDSRSELTFTDLTITRLGANTVFSFNKSGRTANIDSGSILLRVPKNSGGGSIRSSAVTVAITGTTVIFETDSAGGNKLITLEGTSRLSLKSKPGESRKVGPGQMLDVPPGATTLPMPVEIDLDELMRTHPLIVDFKPLPSLALINAVTKRRPPLTQSGPPNQPPGVPPAPPPPPPGPPTAGGGSGQKPFPSPDLATGYLPVANSHASPNFNGKALADPQYEANSKCDPARGDSAVPDSYASPDSHSEANSHSNCTSETKSNTAPNSNAETHAKTESDTTFERQPQADSASKNQSISRHDETSGR